MNTKTYILSLLALLMTGCAVIPGEEPKWKQTLRELQIEEYRIDLELLLGRPISDKVWAQNLNWYKDRYGDKWQKNAVEGLERDIQLVIERQSLIARFQEAYPDTWKQELLKYDLQQKQFHREVALAYLQSIMQQPPETANHSDSYWQERLAKRQYDDLNRTKIIRIKPTR
ncbi:MAG: hypothetical protein ACYTEQ_23355 [Planctomycetota bacterium]|jgi:hypothetical protein